MARRVTLLTTVRLRMIVESGKPHNGQVLGRIFVLRTGGLVQCLRGCQLHRIVDILRSRLSSTVFKALVVFYMYVSSTRESEDVALARPCADSR